jgi:response regulator of citrate/malate metabolism
LQNILVVDDASLIRFRLSTILGSEGFEVYESETAAAVRQNSFAKDISLADIDLILLDIYLKNENGLDLLEFLTAKYPEIPVIIVSGANKAEIIKKAVKLGAKDFIAKPFDKKTVLYKLNNLSTGGKKKNVLDHEESYKTNLSIELNRSLRSKLPFSIVKMALPGELEELKYIEIKNFISSEIRNIDQVFVLADYKYLFILPLTDKEGSEVFIDKITNITLENNQLENKKFAVERLSFPEDITAEEKADGKKFNQYRTEILKKLEL